MKNRVRHNDALQLTIMIAITLITQILAIFKSSFIASIFGAGVELDAYNFANNMTTFVFTFVSAGITTVVLPSYVKKQDKEAVDTFISVIFSVIAVLMIALFLGRSFLVDILTTRDVIFKQYVCSLMALSIFIQLLPAILSVTTAYYQAESRYNIPKIVLLISNVLVISTLVVARDFSINFYLYVLLAGAFVQFLADVVIAVYYGFRFRFMFKIHNTKYHGMMRVFLPTVFSSGIYKVNTMIDSLISSNLGIGQLTILTYSNMVVAMINNMFIGNLSTYAYPKIVRAVKNSDREGQRLMWEYSVYFHFVLCLLIAGFIGVGRELVNILFQHGKFSDEAASVVYICMCIYVFGQQNNIVRDLIYRYFYSKENTKTTTKNSLITSIINASSSIILAQFIGIYGLVLGTVISGLYSLAGIVRKIKVEYGFAYPVKSVFVDFLKNEICLIVSIVTVLIVKKMFIFNVFVSFCIYGALVVLIYMISAFFLKCKVIKIIMKKY